ncbi:MAG: hypothetical protein ACRCYS_12615, partial [Beijerinckiaceae bacterium]
AYGLNTHQVAALAASRGEKWTTDNPQGPRYFDFAQRKINSQYRMVDTGSSTGWAVTGAGVTITPDPDVTFNGWPSLRIFVPGTTTGNVNFQRSAADCQMPEAWDGSGFYFAYRASDMSRFSTVLPFLGDLNFANHYFATYTHGVQETNLRYQANEWVVGNAGWSNVWQVGSGAPTFVGAKQIRLQFQSVTAGADMTIWVADIGAMARHKPRFVLTLDDNYKSWAQWLIPAALYHDIPVSLGIIPPAQGGIGASYSITEAQLRRYADDPSQRIAIMCHGNNNVATDGDALYVDKMIATRTYLQSLGVGDDANYLAWVENATSAGAIAGLIAAGFKGGRGGYRVGATATPLNDGLLSQGHKRRMAVNICAQMDNSMTLATAKANADAVITAQSSGVLMGHDAKPAGDALSWSYADWESLLKYLADKRDAGL